MIHYLCRRAHSYTIGAVLQYRPRGEIGDLRPVSYEALFRRLSLRKGHLIFTDHDRLSAYELEVAASMAEEVARQVPGARIVNHPARFLQRFELLDTLWRQGRNPFRAARLELELPELRYPVFIRREGDAEGPETPLLHSRAELDAAVADLRARGVPLRGRMVVEYCARPDEDGFFRKYGAFRIGDRIVPQHVLFSDHWVAKSSSGRVTERNAAIELDYVRTNPHEAELLELTDIAGAQFGRADYAVIDGRVVLYEFNSNPRFPRGDRTDLRQERRDLVRRQIMAAFRALDTPLPARGRVWFDLPYPRSHDMPGWWFLTQLRLLRTRSGRQRLLRDIRQLIARWKSRALSGRNTPTGSPTSPQAKSPKPTTTSGSQ